MISINLPGRLLMGEIPEEELRNRRANWKPPKMKEAPGILGLFAVHAEQAHQGARLVAHPAPWG
jgi:dihydroxyacid dehydratase/phosphogluconate dehydratase